MATETEQGLSGHLRGVTVTTLACLAGVVAALVSGVVFGTTVEAAENIERPPPEDVFAHVYEGMPARLEAQIDYLQRLRDPRVPGDPRTPGRSPALRGRGVEPRQEQCHENDETGEQR